MTTKCTGLIGRIFGHKFTPCYSLSGGQPMELHGSYRFIEMMMDKSRTKNYHHSLCQRCGAVTGEKK